MCVCVCVCARAPFISLSLVLSSGLGVGLSDLCSAEDDRCSLAVCGNKIVLNLHGAL